LLILTLVTILGGAVLGLRYKVFILLPAATFVLVFVIGVGAARGAAIWRIALDMVVATTALQWATPEAAHSLRRGSAASSAVESTSLGRM
jgi:hypothetical protein